MYLVQQLNGKDRTAMGIHPNIGFDRFPAQGSFAGRRVDVCFDYDASRTIGGKVIREDVEEPGLMLIELDDGRVVRSTECMYYFQKQLN